MKVKMAGPELPPCWEYAQLHFCSVFAPFAFSERWTAEDKTGVISGILLSSWHVILFLSPLTLRLFYEWRKLFTEVSKAQGERVTKCPNSSAECYNVNCIHVEFRLIIVTAGTAQKKRTVFSNTPLSAVAIFPQFSQSSRPTKSIYLEQSERGWTSERTDRIGRVGHVSVLDHEVFLI